ncbi:MAG: hypothetical protein FWC15_02520 [Fibromonadales bacterium]|nr:hypothetical protein [Fibromonadales bacterium]
MLACEPVSPVIAEVENARLHIHELKETRVPGDSISKEEWIRHIEYWVNFEVMYRESLKRGLHKDPAVQKLIRNAEKKILVDRLRLSLDSTIAVESDNELRDYYENNRDLFRDIEFSEVTEQIRGIVLSEKRMKTEKKWLSETKNLYSIEVYPQYLDSLR